LARQKAADLLAQLQQAQNAGSSADKDKKRLEQEIATLTKV
jgi:hypothetical protein